MPVGLQRASVFALAKESTVGTYVKPTAGAQFVPLRPGNELSFEPEKLESDEVLNDIGTSKSSLGKEKLSGKHSAYLKHSGSEGVETEVGVLYESLLGSKNIISVEKTALAASTTSVIKVTAGTDFVQGQALLVKKGNGYKISNVRSISGNDLTLAFALDSAPSAGTLLGKAVTYLPVASGHPTFSTTKYLGNGYAVEASSGNTVTEASIKMDANGYAEVEFSFEGTKYFYNPIEILSSDTFLDFTDNTGTYAAQIAVGVYRTPGTLADALASAMNAVSNRGYTVTFSSSTGKFTIVAGSATLLSLLNNTGTNAANTVADKLGFLVAANKTGALTYTSDNEQSYTASLTPVYDAADNIIIKNAELFLGSQADNICFCAQSVSLSVSKSVEDVDCICEESGVLEKVPTSRAATMEISAVLKKHDVALLDALLKNTGISAVMNCGPKSGGNWVPGKCFNAYMQLCTVEKFTTSGESFISVNISLRGYVTATQKDVYLNFV
ncbi:MAG: hypothetical protein HUM72_12465 [Dolichospermum sp.]|nr:hypothetical protein [Dolichospermum sp.]